jgi:hypothetical protein
VERKALKVKAAYRVKEHEEIDRDGVVHLKPNQNKYGEEAAAAVCGVFDVQANAVHVSRVYQWEIGVQRRAASPWTRVNNCTEGQNDGIAPEGNSVTGSGGEVQIFANDHGSNGGGFDPKRDLRRFGGFDGGAGGEVRH